MYGVSWKMISASGDLGISSLAFDSKSLFKFVSRGKMNLVSDSLVKFTNPRSTKYFREIL